MDRVANSTPMVDLESRLNSLRVKRLSRLDLPTPESPMRTTVRGLVSGVYDGRLETWVPLKRNCSTQSISRYSGICTATERSHRIRRWPSLQKGRSWRCDVGSSSSCGYGLRRCALVMKQSNGSVADGDVGGFVVVWPNGVRKTLNGLS